MAHRVELGDSHQVETISDVDVSSKVSSSYGIHAMPTLIIFNNGKVVDQIIGRMSKNELVTRLEAHLG